jgi:hypothetical protein
MRVQRAKTEPLGINPDWTARWGSPEAGLITSWQRGRELAEQDPDLADAARRGELVPLSWKGGVTQPARGARPPRRKYGSFHYLAMWQGLRGDDLDIDTEAAPERACSRYGTVVVFTDDLALLDR